MARKPSLNWTKSLGQFTATIDGTFHRLGTDRTAAEQQFNFLMAKVDMGEPPQGNPLFADLAEQWLDHVQKNNDPDRYRHCRKRINEFLAFVGGRTKVKELRPSHVENWIAAKENVTKEGTKRLYKAIILACLNWAASGKVRLIARNPLRGKLELPEGGSRGSSASWTPEVFQLVLDNVNDRFADFLRAVAWTGARPSTIRKVEARHYRPALKLWDVEDLYSDRKSRKKYVKRIWLPPHAIEMVERLNQEHPTGPIFRNTHGTPFSGDGVTMMMFKLRRRLKKKGITLPEGLIVYGLRHNFATQFIVKHPDKIEYLRELLGHRDLQMIRKHYSQLFDEHSAMHGVLSGFNPVS